MACNSIATTATRLRAPRSAALTAASMAPAPGARGEARAAAARAESAEPAVSAERRGAAGRAEQPRERPAAPASAVRGTRAVLPPEAGAVVVAVVAVLE